MPPSCSYPLDSRARNGYNDDGYQVSKNNSIQKGTSRIEYTVKVHDNGTREWFLNGNRHREDGPAFEYANGNKEWYLNGKLHREDGPAFEYANGNKCWYLNGKLHREDGPAVELTNGNKEWYLNGKLHRKDGPAIEDPNGNKYWYLNDKQYYEADWKLEVAKLNKQPISCDGKEVEIDGKKYKLIAL